MFQSSPQCSPCSLWLKLLLLTLKRETRNCPHRLFSVGRSSSLSDLSESPLVLFRSVGCFGSKSSSFLYDVSFNSRALTSSNSLVVSRYSSFGGSIVSISFCARRTRSSFIGCVANARAIKFFRCFSFELSRSKKLTIAEGSYPVAYSYSMLSRSASRSGSRLHLLNNHVH